MKTFIYAISVAGCLFAAQTFACECVNTSGNSAYNALCSSAGSFGQCGNYPNICTPVSNCANTSGNSAYDQLCASAGSFGQCGNYPNICTPATCQ